MQFPDSSTLPRIEIVLVLLTTLVKVNRDVLVMTVVVVKDSVLVTTYRLLSDSTMNIVPTTNPIARKTRAKRISFMAMKKAVFHD